MMFSDLKELKIGNMITIDDKNVQELTDCEDYEITEKKLYSVEEGEILFLDLNDSFFLIAHTVKEKPHYYIYELNASGEEQDIEDNGYKLIFREDDVMPRKIYVSRNSDKKIPHKIIIQPLCDVTIDNSDEIEEISICEFRGPIKHIFLEKKDTIFNLYEGFRIANNTILL